MAAWRMRGSRRQGAWSHLADRRSNKLQQDRRGMAWGECRGHASEARTYWQHRRVEQRSLRQVHAGATACPLRATLLAAVGRVHCWRCCGRQKGGWGCFAACAMVTGDGGLQFGRERRHRCVGRPGAHDRHCGCRHGVAQPVEDQAESQKQAQVEAGHFERVWQSVERQRESGLADARDAMPQCDA